MQSLSYGDKVILTLYQGFYGEKYHSDISASTDDMTCEHVMAQKMCYLLSLKGFRIDGFEYTWNTFGPYSPGLQANLRSLDARNDLAIQFYAEQQKLAAPFQREINNLYANARLDGEQLGSLIEGLEIPEKKKQKRNWMELLGSIAYISHTVYPHGPFSWVQEELFSRKSQFNNQEQNIKGWKILDHLELLSVGARMDV